MRAEFKVRVKSRDSEGRASCGGVIGFKVKMKGGLQAGYNRVSRDP